MTSSDAVTPLQVGLLLNRVYGLATQRLNAALRPMDLTGRHAAVMFLIRDGVRTHRDLVGRLHTDKAGMVRVLDDLERRGFVSRTRSTRDRRVWLLSLTPDGTAALLDAQEHTNAVAESLFGALDRAGLESLHRSLTLVALAADER